MKIHSVKFKDAISLGQNSHHFLTTQKGSCKFEDLKLDFDKGILSIRFKGIARTKHIFPANITEMDEAEDGK